MSGRAASRGLLVLLATGAAVALPAAPAAASCAEIDPMGSPVVFVGTAQETSNGHTRFAVGEVWSGPDLAPEVWVRTGQEQPGWPEGLYVAVISSNDADAEDGERYLVGASEDLTTSACSMTSASDPVARPAVVREPVEDGLRGAEPPRTAWETTAWGASVVALGGALVVLVRRRRARAAAGRR
ncbi:hypothetical protein E0W78_08525 [Aeromicrobium sp. IC_218]|nr:hypothetical protein E0W78_08525 [Aeromicrobium sp. IC_218]